MKVVEVPNPEFEACLDEEWQKYHNFEEPPQCSKCPTKISCNRGETLQIRVDEECHVLEFEAEYTLTDVRVVEREEA